MRTHYLAYIPPGEPDSIVDISDWFRPEEVKMTLPGQVPAWLYLDLLRVDPKELSTVFVNTQRILPMHDEIVFIYGPNGSAPGAERRSGKFLIGVDGEGLNRPVRVRTPHQRGSFVVAGFDLRAVEGTHDGVF